MIKILTVIGARPQFIKSAMFSRALSKYPEDFKEVIVHTGQHYDENMSSQFFSELGMPKEDYNLGVNSGSHAEQTGKMLIALEKVIVSEKPDLIVIFGDTNSTLVGALCAAKLNIPVAHIEAGFRSFDRTMPEEVNRVIADHLSTYLFCFTESCVELLKKEGIMSNVFFVGDITYDAALHYSSRETTIVDNLGLDSYIYCTVHRQSNTDSISNLVSIFDALIDSNQNIVIPLHPRTKSKMIEYGIYEKYSNKNIHFIPPVGYLDSLTLTKNAKKIVTDSGGVLKEAYFFKKPCVILRDNVEFIEAVQNGEAILVGSSKEKILDAILNFNCVGKFPCFFGDGNASEKIVEILTRVRY